MQFKVGLVSLGCPKNLVDSENMLGILKNDGFMVTNEPSEAEILIVNTCGFIGDAKEESVNTILEMSEYKKTGNCKLLVATGCLAERYSEDIKKEIPEVDLVVGTGKFPEIAKYISESMDFQGEKIFAVGDIDREFNDDLMPRMQSTPKYMAYVKISDGCDKKCTYCIIPKLRGKYRSRTISSIVNEIKKLAMDGVKEVVLIAQDTSCYGIDIYGDIKLAELLDEISKIEGINWIRFLYTYPENINDELIKVIKNNKKICKYIDMPIQHASNKVLKTMGRKDKKEDILNVISKLRSEIPNIILRTSLIVGFPEETQEDFEELYRFVEDTKFNKLGVFKYSAEEGTPAADFKNQIDEAIKEQRYNKIMDLQKKISYNINSEYLAKEFEVLVEGFEEFFYYGRTYMDVPEIDGKIYFASDRELNLGEIVKVRVVEVREYDIMGEIINET